MIRHLRKEKELTVAKSSPGVYYINKETFHAQIIVTKELPSEENLYLQCLTNELKDMQLVNKLADDYKLHQEQEIYIRYMHQLTTANGRKKGETLMVCEGLLNLVGTSSEEIIERTKKEEEEYDRPKIEQLSLRVDDLSFQNESLSSRNENLSSQINYLKSLLARNNIPFHLGTETDND